MVSDITAGDGNIAHLFLQCILLPALAKPFQKKVTCPTWRIAIGPAVYYIADKCQLEFPTKTSFPAGLPLNIYEYDIFSKFGSMYRLTSLEKYVLGAVG